MREVARLACLGHQFGQRCSLNPVPQGRVGHVVWIQRERVDSRFG